MTKGFDVFDPFLTFARQHPDFDAGDERRETEMLAQRQNAIMGWLEGTTPSDVLFDMLEEQGIGAAPWLDAAEANIAYVIDQGIPFVSNESGLLLPVSCRG
ncbi:MAG: hypothetical protein AAF215_31550 [Cyanobacteria bacterium P01_A01_bin.123]